MTARAMPELTRIEVRGRAARTRCWSVTGLLDRLPGLLGAGVQRVAVHPPADDDRPGRAGWSAG